MRKKLKKGELPTFWSPQKGPQTLAAVCPADEVFYGGTRGGGKSDCAIGRQVRGAVKYADKWNGLIVRRKYKDLAEMRRRFDELIKMGMPATRVGGENQTNYVRWSNGASITLAAIQRVEQCNDWLGHQFTEITVDEAPSFSFVAIMVDKLKGSLRSPHGVPCHMFLTGNPGGPGSASIKMMYVEPTGADGNIIPRNTINRLNDGTTRIFIHSTLYDNKILVDNDPQYVKRLLSIQDPNLRAAWVEGRWDVYVGQAFDFNPISHTIPPVWPIPEHAPIYMTFDWGFGAPFSVGWWWVDSDNRIYRFSEWYGWNGKTPNVGCRLVDTDIIRGICEREQKMGILGRDITRLAGHDCFNKKPNYMGGGQGPSTADEFVAYQNSAECMDLYGPQRLQIYPADPSRDLKIRQFRNRLLIPKEPDQMPMMVVYNTCSHFIRTVPSLCLDETKVEDIEDGQEDHIYDEAAQICMARPIGEDDLVMARTSRIKREKERVNSLDGASRVAASELHVINKRLAEDADIDTRNDPRLDPSVFGFDEDDDRYDTVDADMNLLAQLGLLGG